MSFSAKFTLETEWFDGRLNWKDLNKDESLNIPREDIIQNIWVPILTFENTESKLRTPVDEEARIMVKAKTTYTLSPMSEMEEVAYYNGSENSIIYSRDFNIQFDCEFNLRNYPFDTQHCTILLKIQKKEKKFIRLNPKGFNFTGSRDMAEYFLEGISVGNAKAWQSADIVVDIVLKRRISKHIINTYLPSVCILTIAQVHL